MPVSYVVILMVLLLLVIILSVKTTMLRNVVFDKTSFDAVAKTHKLGSPKAGFSLSRSQLAFWTVIIIGSFVYVVFFYDTSGGLKIPIVFNSVNLTLLGIAAGTTAIGKVIDNSQQRSPTSTTSSAQQNQPSKGFFTDIISDENGVSVHRLQNVLWTIIVGAIYITYVSTKSTLPDDNVITPTLLGLMGISSAAYIGGKTTENSSPVPQPSPATPPIQPQAA
jgi:hypothetical protein